MIGVIAVLDGISTNLVANSPLTKPRDVDRQGVVRCHLRAMRPGNRRLVEVQTITDQDDRASATEDLALDSAAPASTQRVPSATTRTLTDMSAVWGEKTAPASAVMRSKRTLMPLCVRGSADERAGPPGLYDRSRRVRHGGFVRCSSGEVRRLTALSGRP